MIVQSGHSKASGHPLRNRHRSLSALVALLATLGDFATGMPDARAADVHPICAQMQEEAQKMSVQIDAAVGFDCDMWEVMDAKGSPRTVMVGKPRAIDFSFRSWGNSDFLLLGEVHDNGHHHTLRRNIIETIKSSHDLGTFSKGLVFEHIRADQQPALDTFAEFNAKARRLGNSGDLFRFLDWDKSGWPDKKIFEPLFSAAINARLPILPGDPPRERVRAIAKGGAAALTDEERQRFKLDQPLEPKLQDALLDDLEASHCGLMPKTAFGGMAVAQRYRDAHLADALAEAAGKHGAAILLAGNGHVRKDRGVPYYLQQMAPNRKVVSVMLLEVEDGKNDPQAYIPRDPDGKPAVDYILFTPRAERKDPCAEMRERFGWKK